jgi:hypothetical protein
MDDFILNLISVRHIHILCPFVIRETPTPLLYQRNAGHKRYGFAYFHFDEMKLVPFVRRTLLVLFRFPFPTLYRPSACHPPNPVRLGYHNYVLGGGSIASFMVRIILAHASLSCPWWQHANICRWLPPSVSTWLFPMKLKLGRGSLRVGVVYTGSQPGPPFFKSV